MVLGEFTLPTCDLKSNTLSDWDLYVNFCYKSTYKSPFLFFLSPARPTAKAKSKNLFKEPDCLKDQDSDIGFELLIKDLN